MFSSVHNGLTNGASPAASTRGRRRQRPLSNDDSVRQPKAKRARIPLNEQTFVNPEVTTPETYEVKPARPSSAQLKQDGVEPSPQVKKDLSFRSKKAKTGERLNKGDGSVVLTSNNGFVVSKLPALPDRLRADAQSRQHGFLDPLTGYALSLTHTHAIVWPYSAATASPESFTFELPYPSKNMTDPLPLGALVPPSASSSEPGLVVVIPTSGKITYWESIASATTLDFIRQQRNGVEDSISGMWSSETVIRIVSVESAAGFVLAFSSGRMAYISVRDAHGRPQISVQFLRTSWSPSGGGIFGSIRNVLSHSSIQGDIAAVKSDRSSRQGEQTVVAATSKGRFHAWKIHRGGHHDLLAEIDARELVADAISQQWTDPKFPHESLKVIDFTFAPRDLESRHAELSQLRFLSTPDDHQHLLLLTSLANKTSERYFLVELLLPNSNSAELSARIGAVRPIKSYTTPPDTHALAGPRLYLPRPAVVAFVVFERATVIASLARAPDSPDSQLLEDNDILPATYEDVVDLRADPTLEIVGSGIEEPVHPGTEELRTHRIRSKNPAAVILVRSAGIIRITTTDVERFASEKPPQITAKSKLEQAVFFGIKEGNPLVFDVPRELPFSEKELTDAALELSHDILSSNSPHLTVLAANLGDSMRERVKALEKLIAHLRSLKVTLSRATKWELLWNAERLQAARFIWAKHEKFVQARPDNSKRDVVAEIVTYIQNEEKHQPNEAKGEVDPLRHWFVHDAYRMEYFLAWTYEVIKYNTTMAKADESTLTRFIYEAMEIMNGALRDAMEFRAEHLASYGLEGERMANGILSDNYAGLRVPWTCEKTLTNNLRRLVELATTWDGVHFRHNAPLTPENTMLQRIRVLLPATTEVYLTTLLELSRWARASESSNTSRTGQTWEHLYQVDRHEKVVSLAGSENWDAAYRLAEQHQSLGALAQVLIDETQEYKRKLEAGGLTPDEAHRFDDLLTAKDEQRLEYFNKYGQDFTFPYFDYQIKVAGIDSLLETKGDRHFKTSYLRTKPELARISWMNDIISEDDIVHAANTLLDLGMAKEQQVWNKKIELSLGKLARMAEASRPSSKASFNVQEATIDSAVTETGVDAIDKQLAIIKIQNQLYGQISPVLQTAVDESAQLPVAMDAFAMKIPKKYKILTEIFEDGLSRLLKHEALDALTLIDLLTMIRLDPEYKDLMPDPIYQAIEVANLGLDGEERDEAERSIWRRCYLREEWTKINNTSLKGDADVMEALGDTELFQVFCVLCTIQQKADGTNYRRWLPSDVLGVYTKTLDKRFRKQDKSAREKLLEAMQWEDNNLRKHIDKHRLDQWAKETRKMAQEAVIATMDHKTEEGANAKSPTSKTLNGTATNGIH